MKSKSAFGSALMPGRNEASLFMDVFYLKYTIIIKREHPY